MKVTIRKIAEIAGVSRGTVDKVLNNRPGVSDAVRAKVNNVASALHYKPNLIGKALAGQQSPKKIGIIVAPDYNPFVSDIKKGIETAKDEIADYGFLVDMRVLNTLEVHEQLNILDSFINNKVDGIALFSTDNEEIRRKVDQIVQSGTPVVTYNSDILNSKRMCYVGQDHFNGGLAAADLMSKIAGSGDVLIITSLKTLSCHRERIAGFETGIEQYGAALKVAEIVENQDKEKFAFEMAMEKLEKNTNIKGIYVTGGGANGVGEALIALGQKDICLICHDLVEPTIPLLKDGVIDFAIGQDPVFQGYKPVKLLFEYLIAGHKPKCEYIRTRIDIRSRSNI